MTEIWNNYDPTAARPRTRPGRDIRPATPTIDMHAHVAVPAAGAIAGPHLDPATIPLARFQSPESKAVSVRQDGDLKAGRMADQAARIAELDRLGIDRQLVLPPPPQCYYTVPLPIAVEATRVLNDGLAEWAGRRPDRFSAFGSVPLQDGEAAADELERVTRDLGFRGVQVLTNVAGRELSDPAFAPFWAKAEELDALVVIHPNGFTEAGRLERFYFNNVIGNPLETTIALHYLIFDGVLERHPGLKILAVHGGGYLGAYPGRIDHAWGARSDCHAGLPHPPTHYLRKIFVDTVVFTPGQLETLVGYFGPEKVLMGTDIPFDMGEYDPVEHVVAANLDPDAVAAICGGNALRLLGL